MLEVKLEVGVILGPDPEHLTVGQIRPDGVCFVSLFPIRGPVGWGPRKGKQRLRLRLSRMGAFTVERLSSLTLELDSQA